MLVGSGPQGVNNPTRLVVNNFTTLVVNKVVREVVKNLMRLHRRAAWNGDTEYVE